MRGKEEFREEDFLFYEAKSRPPRFPSLLRALIILGAIGVVIFFLSFASKYLKPKPPIFTSLLIDSVPQGAAVYLDDVQRGSTPLYISDIVPDAYNVKLVKEGFAMHKERVQLKEGMENKVFVHLVDIIPPKIFTLPIPETRADAPLRISAQINDNTAVKHVYLFYRREGVKNFKKKLMRKGKGSFFATIGAENIKPPALLWYISASDGRNTARSPKRGYHRVQVIPRIGSVYVASTPSGATVYLDGKRVGTTPCTITGVYVGYHDLLLRKKHYAPCRKRVRVLEGQTKSVSYTLKILPATLSLKSEPEASVYLDGKSMGKTPKILKGLTPYTEYELLLRAPGYRSKRVTLTLEPGERKKMHISLQRIYARAYITSIPPGAAIYVDGKFLGYTPIREALLGVGNVKIKASKDGYKDALKEVKAVEGEITFVNFVLTPSL